MNKSKIALVTGANKGIGFETVRQLAQKNITVFLGARDPAKGEAAAVELAREKLDVRPIVIDVTNEKSIAAAVTQIGQEFGRLDILINNAGVLLDDYDKKVSEQSLDTWRATLQTNVLGVVAVTQAFLPLLRKSEAGRIVNLSSILGSITYHATPGSPVYDFKVPAYNVSKSAINAYTVQLAYELKDSKIKVNAAHPGWVKTELGGEGANMETTDGARTSVQLATLNDDGPNGSFQHLGETIPW